MRSSEVRKYFVKGSWIFNLESMNDHLWCIIDAMRDGEIELPVYIAGREYRDEDEVEALKEECHNLEWIAKSRKVTGREYGRIKEIVEYRVGARYMKCLASGMSEYKAGACFQDL